MDRNEIIVKLKELQVLICRYDEAKRIKHAAILAYNEALATKPNKVDKFDAANKETYILSKIGPKPVPPKSVLALAVPVYLAKKKAYEKEKVAYDTEYAVSESDYYQEYAEQRAKIDSDNRKEIALMVSEAEDEKTKAEAEYNAAKSALDNNDLISDRLKKFEAVDTMISYFQDQRADTLKEAINLYYEELHRQELEKYAQMQLKLTEEAKEYARQAAESASEAVERANEAAESANETISLAQKALDRAEEAYAEAQNAYYAATSDD